MVNRNSPEKIALFHGVTWITSNVLVLFFPAVDFAAVAVLPLQLDEKHSFQSTVWRRWDL